MGALISRCLKWRSDPDPIGCQQLCASANNSRSWGQRQQKKAPQPRSCAASGPQRLLDSRKFYQRPGLQGSHLTGADPATPPSPRSKDGGFSGLCSASPAGDRPPTPKFLLGRQQIKSPDGTTNAAYGSCSFSFPQQQQLQQASSVQPCNPYGGDLRYPQQQAQQQQNLPRHLQEDEELGSRVKRTLSLRLSTRNCDTADTPRKARSIRSKGNARPRDN